MALKKYRVLQEFKWSTGGPLFNMLFKPNQIIEASEAKMKRLGFIAKGWVEEAGPTQQIPVHRF